MGADGGGVTSTPQSSLFEELPDDVLGHVFERLELDELMGLARLNKRIQKRVMSLGVPIYLARHSQHHLTVSSPASTKSTSDPTTLLRHNTLIDRSLSSHQWHAIQVGPTWPSSVIPAMSLSPDRLIYGVGGKLVVHEMGLSNRRRVASDMYPLREEDFDDEGDYRNRRLEMKSVKKAKEYQVAKKWAGSGADIIGVAELDVSLQDEGSRNRQIIVAQFDGTLQRFSLPLSNSPDLHGSTPSLRSTAHYTHPPNSSVHTLSVSGGHFMTTTSSGLVSLFRANSPWLPPTTLQLKQKSRAWSSLLTIDRGRNQSVIPSMMIGVSGSIEIYDINSSGKPSSQPYRRLIGPNTPARSSPYDLCLSPSSSSSSSWHNPQTLLSAWYDSYVRVHDLRSPSSGPVMEFNDPWADSPMYSCCFTGTYHVVGGGARHGMVGIWDVRYSKPGSRPGSGGGWSCFTPGGKGSPVYKLQGEGGRVWGVTEKRGFVLGFDGSGGDDVDGLVFQEARSHYNIDGGSGRRKAVEVPTKYRNRGGKWGWSVRYDKDEVNKGGVGGDLGIGYLHRDRVVKLFDSLPVRGA